MKPVSAISLLTLCALLAGCGSKARIDRHVQRGDAYFAKKDYERARLEYMNAQRERLTDPHLITQLGIIFFERGEFDLAKTYLDKAKIVQPTNLTARTSLAALNLAAGNRDVARAEAEYVLSNDPGHGEALLILATSITNATEAVALKKRFEDLDTRFPANPHVKLAIGTLCLAENDTKSAESAFIKAKTIEPSSPKVRIALANLYWREGQTNQADIEFKAASELDKPRSQVRLQWAKFKRAIGQQAESRQIIEEMVRQVPDYVPAINALAELSLAEGRNQEASSLIEKALFEEPSNQKALLTRYKLRALERDYLKAYEDLEVLKKLRPADGSIPYYIAMMQLATNDTARALASLDQALTLDTNHIDALCLRSEIQLRRGDPAGAIIGLIQVTERYPKFTKAQQLLAQAFLQRGTPNDALQVYSKLAQLTPEDPNPLLQIGAVFRENNRTNEARQAFEKSLEVSPGFPPALEQLTQLDIEAGNFDQALRRINALLQENPQKPEYHLFLARILAAQKQIAAAETAFRKAFELNPTYLVAYQGLAQMYQMNGQPAKAIAALESAREKVPSDAQNLYFLGFLYETTGKRSEAIKAFENAITVDPKHAQALNNLAYLLNETGQSPERALELARAASEAAPEDPFIGETLGWILFQRGDYSRSLPLIQRAVDRAPDEPEFQYHLGMVHFMSGHEASAREALARAAQSSKSFPQRNQATAAFETLNINPSKSGSSEISSLEQKIAQNPKDLFAFLRLAQIRARQNDNDKALKSFEAAYAVNPKALAVLIDFAAFSLDSLNNKSKALNLAKEARSVSQEPTLGTELGRIGVRAGDYPWAAPILDETLRLDPDNPRAALYAGLATFSLDSSAQGIADIRKAMSASEEFPEKALVSSLLILSEAYRAPALPGRMSESVSAVVQAWPDFPLAGLGIGLVKEARNELKAAREAYEKALAEAPGFVPARRQLTILLADKLKEDSQAQEVSSRIRNLAATDPGLARSLGMIAYRRGDFRESIPLLRNASEGDRNADVLYHLGLAQNQVGDRESKKILTEALALGPDHTLAPQARRILQTLR